MAVSAVDISAEEAAVAKVEQKSKRTDFRSAFFGIGGATWFQRCRMA